MRWNVQGARSIPADENAPSPRESSALQLQRLLCQRRKVHLLMTVLRHMLAGRNAVDCHLGVELKTAEELRRDEEVLASSSAVFASSGAGDVDETGVDEARKMSVSGSCNGGEL